ncbi:hypothetical protein JCM3775_004118 [Rhodotorula graminis]
MADPFDTLSSPLTPLTASTSSTPASASLAAPTVAQPGPSAPGTPAVQSPYLAFRTAIRHELRDLAQSLKTRRDHDEPATAEQLHDAVHHALSHAGALKRSEMTGRPDWEVDARQATLTRAFEELVNEAATTSSDDAAFAHLQDLLDAVLCAYESEYLDEMVPLNILSALMDLRPVTACEPLLSYIETRSERLTKGMDSARGRGPILLRLLNDLLRRLPRSQSGPVILSGRILLLLSSVFPLGEKSGVNLRGGFNLGKGSVWEQEVKAKEIEGAKADAAKEEQDQAEGKGKEGEDAKMGDVEEGEEAEAGSSGTSSGFYATFWSLQRVFNNPHLLFSPAPPSSSSSPLADLQTGVRKTLAAFDAATKKEKELSGTAAKGDKAAPARGGEGAKEADEGLEEYFFPKFLTSRNLLDLELSDPSFRRQILVQLLILFQYLLSLTPSARARTAALPVTNQPALSPHVLGADDEKWVRELRSRTLDEMDDMQGGRRFRKAVMVVLTREQNWTDWKLRSCQPFTKPALATADVSATARARHKALARRPKRFPYALGNPRLDRLWRHNTTSLDGFEPSVGADDLSSLLAPTGAYSQSLAALRRLRSAGASAASSPGALASAEAAHQAAQWRAVRAAASSELRFFARIGAGDVEKLKRLMDEERRESEEREGPGEGAVKGEEQEEDEKGEYDSDESVLGLRPPKVREKEAGTPEPPAAATGARDGDDAKMDVEPPAAAAAADGDDDAGTPPPPPSLAAAAAAPSSSSASSAPSTSTAPAPAPAPDEPGTPPPPSPQAETPPPRTGTTTGATVAEPGTPGTPKRARAPEDEGEREREGDEVRGRERGRDVEMGQGEGGPSGGGSSSKGDKKRARVE